MNKVAITLSGENLREITEMEKRRVLHPTDPQNDPDCIHIKVVEAAIEQGIIEQYVPTLKDRLIPILDALNRLELGLKQRLMNPFQVDQPVYRDVVARAAASPSVLAELNEMVSDHGIKFTESHYEIQIHKGDRPIVNLSVLGEDVLRDILSAVEPLLKKHKENKDETS